MLKPAEKASMKRFASASGAAVLAFSLAGFIPNGFAGADTYSDLVSAQRQQQSSAQREADLRNSLAGVNQELAQKVLELDSLINTQIPAAQTDVVEANNAYAQAKSEEESATARLKASQKDLADLQAKIEQTGKDYDDAKALVAQMVREDLQGSEGTDVMDVLTGAGTAEEFVESMQSREALSRSEANAASEAADILDISANRSQRLEAIEKRINALKVKAENAAAAAKEASDTANAKIAQLEQLRSQSETRSQELLSRHGELETESARQAAQTLFLQNTIDQYNLQYAEEQRKAQQDQNGAQDRSKHDPYPTPTPSPTPTPDPSPSPSPDPGGQGTHNGDYGHMYMAGQCTWYAYNRRAAMGIGTPSYLGNGGQWWQTAPNYGLRVDHNPRVGAALSFLPGQEYAVGTYGHVAVVEQVGNGYIVISEMNVKGPYVVSSRTLYSPSRFYYVH